MEQFRIDLPGTINTFDKVFHEITSIISENGLPSDVLRLKQLSQSNTINIMVLEKLMCKISKRQDALYVLFHLRLQKEVHEIGLNYEADHTLANFIRVAITPEQPVLSLTKVLLAAYKSAYRENADASFGCCSRFIECSDARKCTNPNRIFALGCAYKDNLESGRIFYGQNPTV